MKTQQSRIYSGSITNKVLNRDAAREIHVDTAGITGVVIADGIGRNNRVEEAAQWAVQFIEQEVSKSEPESEIDFMAIYQKCQAGLKVVFNTEIDNNQFGTTLITAIEIQKNEKRSIRAAYAGNGAIWHIKGNFNEFVTTHPFPWSCANYLIPHSVLQGGKEALTNCISLEQEENFKGPTTIDISCDKELGDIIMICTDGIYSLDQIRFANDGLGALWQRQGESIIIFMHYLNHFFTETDQSEDALKIVMDEYLEKLREDNLLEDDATIGIIITPQALSHQNKFKHGPVNTDS
jgi:PPM family protein phosphatase